jgi:hypothetical protein
MDVMKYKFLFIYLAEATLLLLPDGTWPEKSSSSKFTNQILDHFQYLVEFNELGI